MSADITAEEVFGDIRRRMDADKSNELAQRIEEAVAGHPPKEVFYATALVLHRITRRQRDLRTNA